METQSFIRQAAEVRTLLKYLAGRAEKEGSSFEWQIKSALSSIEAITKTYEEVLSRDANEDEPYFPTGENDYV